MALGVCRAIDECGYEIPEKFQLQVLMDCIRHILNRELLQ